MISTKTMQSLLVPVYVLQLFWFIILVWLFDISLERLLLYFRMLSSEDLKR